MNLMFDHFVSESKHKYDGENAKKIVKGEDSKISTIFELLQCCKYEILHIVPRTRTAIIKKITNFYLKSLDIL